MTRKLGAELLLGFIRREDPVLDRRRILPLVRREDALPKVELPFLSAFARQAHLQSRLPSVHPAVATSPVSAPIVGAAATPLSWVSASNGPIGPVATTSPTAVISQTQGKQDHMDALDLAKAIIEGKKDFVVVDLRQPWEFDDYHIPGAVHIPLDQILGDRAKSLMPKDKTVVLYSSGGAHAAQAWVLLAQRGYTAKSLLDGMQGWWREVMTPSSLTVSDESKDATEYKARKSVRDYFMGGSAPGKGVSPDVATAPTQAAPSAPSSPAPAPAKTKGGGC